MKPRACHERVSAFAARAPRLRKTSYSQECIYRLENFRDVTPRRNAADPTRETSFYRESRLRDAQREPSRVKKNRHGEALLLSRGDYFANLCKFVSKSVSRKIIRFRKNLLIFNLLLISIFCLLYFNSNLCKIAFMIFSTFF